MSLPHANNYGLGQETRAKEMPGPGRGILHHWPNTRVPDGLRREQKQQAPDRNGHTSSASLVLAAAGPGCNALAFASVFFCFCLEAENSLR